MTRQTSQRGGNVPGTASPPHPPDSSRWDIDIYREGEINMIEHTASARRHPARGALCALATILLLASGSTACAAPRGSAGSGVPPSATIPQPTLERLKKGLPVSPDDRRVDIAMPAFSNPTKITNPLFPISDLHSVVLLGNVDRRLLRTETTLVKKSKTIEWMGQRIPVLESQYVAYLDGRIEEVALDWYAQSDDGAVWYFGEDVFNYEDGSVKDREGSWVAGEDGPPAMIMPANPRVGNVFRTENIPGVAFEEVRVKAIGQTVDGPRGRVPGAMTSEELHMDGNTSDKVFAPGYGEFLSGGPAELEALALAAPTDTRPGPVPAEIETLAHGAEVVFDASRARDWSKAELTLREMNAAWARHQGKGPVSRLLAAQMRRALAALAGDALTPAVDAHDAGGAARASTTAAIAALDLQLQYRSPREIDRARFAAWSRQLIQDADGDDPGAVAGSVTILEWIRDRIGPELQPADAGRIEAELAELRSAADAEDLGRAARGAARLRQTAAALRLVSQNQK